MGMVKFRKQYANEDRRTYLARSLDFYQKQIEEVDKALDENARLIARTREEIDEAAKDIARAKRHRQQLILQLRIKAIFAIVWSLVGIGIVVYLIAR